MLLFEPKQPIFRTRWYDSSSLRHRFYFFFVRSPLPQKADKKKSPCRGRKRKRKNKQQQLVLAEMEKAGGWTEQKVGGRKKQNVSFIVIVKAKCTTLSDCYHHLCKAHIWRFFSLYRISKRAKCGKTIYVWVELAFSLSLAHTQTLRECVLLALYWNIDITCIQDSVDHIPHETKCATLIK